VVGFTTGSIGEVPGKKKNPGTREHNNNNNNDNNNNNNNNNNNKYTG
jgi:hypothetical protein